MCTHRHTLLSASLLALLIGSVVACSGPASGGPDDPQQKPITDGGTDAPWSADTGPVVADTGIGPTDTGSGADTGPVGDGGCTPTDTLDDPDDDGVDANCDGADGVVGKDVYVDATTGLSTNPGTPKAPLATLEQGIKLAVSRSGRVLVAAGTYTLDKLDASGEWKVLGGYDASFRGKPSRTLTTLNVPSTGLVLSAASRATLAHLTILGANADAKTPPSAHALRTSVEDLLLDDVLVRAGDARSGVDGADGALGLAGATGKPGMVSIGNGQTLCADGAFGGTKTIGAMGGSASPDGKPAGVGGSPGGNGGDGLHGADGLDAVRTPRLKAGLLEWASAKPGLGDGTPGYGGAGGANKDVGGYVGILKGGQGGNGGCPGHGGDGAESGGGSAAIVLLGGKVTVKRSELRTGVGGNGGNGGVGGAGGAGGKGGAKQCASPDGTLCGSDGGNGGSGGKGGHGGGGGGGWTLGIVTTGTATATTDPSTTFLLGAPGVGGEGAAGYAAGGDKRNTLKLD
jgi:hypothetical protein